MNPLKSEIKLYIYNELAERFGELILQSEKEQMSCVGAKNALLHTRREVSNLLSEFDKDLDAGTLKLEHVQVAKRRVMRMDGALENLALRNELDSIRMVGRVEAFRMGHKLLQKQFEEEKAKLEVFEKELSASKSPDSSAFGNAELLERESPVSLAQLRKAEEAVVETPLPQAETLPDIPPPVKVPQTKPPTKRRGGRAKNS